MKATFIFLKGSFRYRIPVHGIKDAVAIFLRSGIEPAAASFLSPFSSDPKSSLLFSEQLLHTWPGGWCLHIVAGDDNTGHRAPRYLHLLTDTHCQRGSCVRRSPHFG